MKEILVGLAAPALAGRWGAAPPQALLERMKDYGQEGAFALWDELSPEERELLVLPMIHRFSEGKLTVVLLAGGQGTQLGSSDPKGCFSFLSENPESTEAKIFQINLDNGLKEMARKGSYVPPQYIPTQWSSGI